MARAPSSIAMPRSRNASCTTSATSRSSEGRICGARREQRARATPQLWKNSANSQPVAPAPTTSSCSGNACRPEHVARVEHALVVDLRERRLPRGGAGADEQVVVLERARAALGRHDEHAVALDGALAVDDRGLDQIEALAHAARLVLSDEARVRHRRAAGRRAGARARRRRRATPRARSRPSRTATCSSVLDGMPSVIVQLPPSAMRSTIVTSAPSAAAVEAAA